MIAVKQVPKPRGFDSRARKPGRAWLKSHPKAKRPKDLWSPFLPDLSAGFAQLCGYAAMLDPTGGTVDHYLSFKNRPDLAYEWSNYRFASQALNASKSTADDAVLDPFEVGDDWFEIILPSLQLQLSPNVPSKWRRKAEYTLKRLKLRDGERILRWRSAWYEMFRAGKLSLDGLEQVAPLIARAIRKQSTPRSPTGRRATPSGRKVR